MFSGKVTTRHRACGKATTLARSTGSAVYYFDDAQRAAAESSRVAYQRRLREAGFGEITTEIAPAPTFYYAEAYHQQYLAEESKRLLRAWRHRRLVPDWTPVLDMTVQFTS